MWYNNYFCCQIAWISQYNMFHWSLLSLVINLLWSSCMLGDGHDDNDERTQYPFTRKSPPWNWWHQEYSTCSSTYACWWCCLADHCKEKFLSDWRCEVSFQKQDQMIELVLVNTSLKYHVWRRVPLWIWRVCLDDCLEWGKMEKDRKGNWRKTHYDRSHLKKKRKKLILEMMNLLWTIDELIP